MTPNVGGADRIIRIVVGVVLLALAFLTGTLGTGTLWWVGVIAGVVLLGTGLMRFCALYPLLGISTCQTK